MSAFATPPRPVRRVWHGTGQVLRVAVTRLRFLFVLGAIGAVIFNWDELVARYEKYVHSHDSEAGANSDTEFFCPMHPSIVRPTNKEKCPICFMPLSKRKKGEATDDALPAGTVSRVQLSPYRVVLAGVRTVPVAYHALTRDITTVGTVEFDERNLRTVAARVKGRLDKLFVNQTGQMVHAGDPLAELYSPDLVVTVQNLLDSRTAGNKAMEANARERLRLWGIDDAQVEDVMRTGTTITRLTIRSPIDGHVLKKYQREGQYVEESGPLFEVADLSTVWVQAQLYEDDLAFLPPGGHNPKTGNPTTRLPVTAFARAFPGRPFDGVLSFLFPHVDPETRTLTVRFEVGNPDHELRPGMTATVTLKLSPELLLRTPAGAGLQTKEGQILAVPETAVIDTGKLKVVYRETLPNTFDGISVELGARLNTANGAVYYPVRSGLIAGEQVVAAGSFLIDAETRLNPAMGSIYIGGSGSKSGPSAVRPSTPEDENAKVHAALGKLSAEDQALAASQVSCPILGNKLGSMEVPPKVVLDGKPVLLCCKGCINPAKDDPAKTLARVAELKAKGGSTAPPAPSSSHPPATGRSATRLPAQIPAAILSAEELTEIRTNLAKLPPADKALAEAQRLCPVLGEPLGSMSKPIKLTLGGQPVFVCCKTCITKAQNDPESALKKVASLKSQPVTATGGRP